ncbi:type II and III secretion system protein family protein [Novosphingobium piscinae]|uniref:Type II and III secretion system protein family protein n=1 Tax=Novosphingobium piscinae TaxID=1507448 RepID=A0A7X1G1D5_9SPHN|nr:type II and III secretion system protein family protein [Novosphingobium piscinae]MBC2670825.1 type II and III secretion system protein family protein [Novosphingobium piscinae]
MTRRLSPSFLAAVAVLPPLAALSDPAAAQVVTKPRQEMVLSIGRGQLINVPGRMADVFVADDKIADVQIKSTNQLYIMAKAAGVTTIYASDPSGTVIFSTTVRVGSNIDSVDQVLRVAMPEAKIAVSTFGSDTVLLTGTIPAPEDAAEAQRLVQAFMGKSTNVISRLRTATPLQVNLQVRIAEVSRSLVKSLSSNLTSIENTGGFMFGIGQGRSLGTFNVAPNATPAPLGIGNRVTGTYFNPADPANPITVEGSNVTPPGAGLTSLVGTGRLFGVNVLGALDAGETVGLVTTLAQPNLTAVSGETADFLAGGEFPIPMSQGLGTVAVEYKRYGVSLSYTPTVMSNGRISLRVRPEVSELSSQGAITLNGFTVPALTTRRAETTIELGSGQSFMIGGLLRTNSANSVTKMPGVGDVPILGALFRSTGFQRGETELVIVVTPYLVQPVDANQIKLPTDGYQSPNDIQRLIGNMQSDGRSGRDRPKPTEAPTTQAGTPAPKVGAADPQVDAAIARALAEKAPRKDKARTTPGDTAQPGFSLK